MKKKINYFIINRHNGQGFTLIEVMVAVLILAIGLLGLANLQIKGMQYSDGARQRAQATFLAYDILDRMRANRDEVISGSYDVILNETVSEPAATQLCTVSTVDCTPAQLAAHDLWEWKQELLNNLPGGDGRIQQDVGVLIGTVYNITVQWNRSAVTDTDKATAQGTALTDSITIETEL